MENQELNKILSLTDETCERLERLANSEINYNTELGIHLEQAYRLTKTMLNDLNILKGII